MFNKKAVLGFALCAGLIGVLSTGVMADPAASNDTISVAVAEDDAVAVSTASMTLLANPKSAENNNVSAMKVTFSNNSHLGFTLTFASTNQGAQTASGDASISYLKHNSHTSGAITDHGLYVAYKMALEKVSGSEGGTVATNHFSTAGFINSTNKTYAISSPTQATNDVIYNLKFSLLQKDNSTVGAKDELFQGTFSDTITVTMADENA